VGVLVIGGTGPTGPDIVAELLRRGHEVTVLHRGLHEPDDDALRQVEHLHADPHFAQTLADGLQGRSFDTVIATYGRMRLNVEEMAGRCERFIGIGGNPVHAGHLDAGGATPSGLRILADEQSPRTPLLPAAGNDRERFAARVRAAEECVFEAAADGAFDATYLRYPMIYGQRSMLRFERGLLARIRAGRHRIVLPDGGLSIYSRMADRNAGHVVGLVLDNPDVTRGRVYQCADDEQFSVRQWAELCAAALGAEVEFVAMPLELARPSWDLLPTGPLGSRHTLVDTTRARRELGYRDVVRPTEILTAVMQQLAADPADTEFDADGEDRVLAAYDQLRLSLTGDVPSLTGARWHP
jgi:nucleoside-diphosphate-sugar epimerase